MADYSIGEHDFLTLSRPPISAAEGLAFVARSGTDGLTAWRTGKRGGPFSVQSVVDAADVDAAAALIDEYRELMAAGPVTMRWNGQAGKDRVKVQTVEPAGEDGVRPIVAATGGTCDPSRALCRAVWTLIPWPD